MCVCVVLWCLALSCLFYLLFDVVFQCLGVGDTALTLALRGGHRDLAEMLVVKGADINHADSKGMPIPVQSDPNALRQPHSVQRDHVLNRETAPMSICVHKQIDKKLY